MNTVARQSGMTLIEIMIALLIGAFLLGGVMQIFINSKQTYRMQENLSRLQENGRFAMDYLSKDVRMVGYWDCMMPSAVNDDINGTEGASGAPDSLTLRGAFVMTRPDKDPSDPTKGKVDCGTAVTAAATVACPQTTAPANFYTDNSSIITYSINSNMLRKITNCTTTDIVEGIENMQILYGIDTDAASTVNFGTPNYYVAANAVANWTQVVSIRITITVRTLDDKLTNTGDGRIRRDFTSTIALRNRLQ